jgi:hypothetical protein
MDETSGVLRPAVLAYINGEPLTPEHIAALRAYLRQWIDAPLFIGPAIDELRAGVDGLTDRAAIDAWLHLALTEGVDPL